MNNVSRLNKAIIQMVFPQILAIVGHEHVVREYVSQTALILE